MIATTARLNIRPIALSDAEFMLELLNDAGWLRNIGDRNVRTLEDAQRDITEKTFASYERNGFGFYLVELEDGARPLGICGLADRPYLEDVDLGFALLERYAGKGYAYEAAKAVAAYASTDLKLDRLLGITRSSNHQSQKLLMKLGFQYERNIVSADTGFELKLYGRDISDLRVMPSADSWSADGRALIAG